MLCARRLVDEAAGTSTRYPEGESNSFNLSAMVTAFELTSSSSISDDFRTEIR